MKKIFIDTNWFRESPIQPYVSEDQTKGLTEGEQVIAMDEDNEWIGTVAKDTDMNSECASNWYVTIDRHSWRDLNFPPFEMHNFNQMTKNQAFEHFTWFKEKKLERLNMLDSAYKLRGGMGELDFSITSLLNLWEWFSATRKETKVITTKKRYDENKIRNVIDWTQEVIGFTDEERLPNGTSQLIMDVSIYFAEVCIKHGSDIHWSVNLSESAGEYQYKPLLSSKHRIYVNPFKIIYQLDKLRIVDQSYGNKMLVSCYDLLFAKLTEQYYSVPRKKMKPSPSVHHLLQPMESMKEFVNKHEAFLLVE